MNKRITRQAIKKTPTKKEPNNKGPKKNKGEKSKKDDKILADVKNALVNEIGVYNNYDKYFDKYPQDYYLGKIKNSILPDEEDETSENEDNSEDESSKKKNEIVGLKAKEKSQQSKLTKDFKDLYYASHASDFGVVLDCPYYDFFAINNQAFSSCQMEDLLKYAQESPYGDLKTKQTRLNKDVRHAYEIKEHLSLTLGGILWMEMLKKEIMKQLHQYHDENNFWIEIYKLNIYPVGGHFAKHQDTPRPGVVNTIVIELPFSEEREGGSFCLSKDCFDVNVDTIFPSNKTEIDKRLKIITFVPNVLHEVKPVKKGYRVTLTLFLKCYESKEKIDEYDKYNQYLQRIKTHFLPVATEHLLPDLNKIVGAYLIEDLKPKTSYRGNYYYQDYHESLREDFEIFKDDLSTYIEHSMGESKFQEMCTNMDTSHINSVKLNNQVSVLNTTILQESIRNFYKKKVYENKKIGLVLSWKYSLDEINLQQFKSVDESIVKCLQALNLHLEMIPILLKSEITKPYDGKHQICEEVYLMVPYEIHNKQSKDEYLVQQYNIWINKYNSSTKKIEKKGLEATAIICYHIKEKTDQLLIKSKEEEGAESTGNESRDGFEQNIYYSTLLVVSKISNKKRKK